MPKEVGIHLMFPSQDAHAMVKKKIALNARYRDEKAEIDTALAPGMTVDGYAMKLKPDTVKLLQRDLSGAEYTGEEMFLDAENGIPVKYRGLKGWVGPDPRYQFASDIKKDAQDLRARGENMLGKYAWHIVVIIGLFVVGFVADAYVTAEVFGK